MVRAETMATQLAETDLDGAIDDDEDYDTTDAEPGDGEDDGGEAHEPDGDGEDEADVVTFGGEEQQGEPDTPAIRQLREANKELKRRLKDAEGRSAPVVEEDLGEEPNPDDFWDDPQGLLAAVRAYDAKAARVETARREREQTGQRLQQRWEQQRDAYETGWGELRVPSKDAAREKVEQAFSDSHQAMLVKAARGNAAGFIFALGNSQERIDKLKALADDPAEFIAEAAVMAKDVQVQRRKPTTQPEGVHRGGGGASKMSDQRLERLQAEARNSGDWSKVIAYEAKK